MMGMGMEHGQRMDMRPSPSLIQFTQILALSGLELQEMIHAEVAENPALELQEAELCPACGDLLLPDGTCFRCRRGETLVRQAERATHEEPEEDFDLLTLVADQRSMAEHLMSELRAVVDDEDLPIAEYLVGELDARGFLDQPLGIVAASLAVDEPRVERVLHTLQAVGPLGLGARSVEECLQLQLDRWAESGVEHPLARRLVVDHLEALGAGRYSQLARELEVDYDEVIAARDFIRSHLRPYPIAERTDLKPWDRQTGPGYVAPDVVVRLSEEDQIEIEVLDSRRYGLSISPMYRQLVERLEAGREEDEAKGLSEDDREHVRAQVGRARQFLSHIRERRDTMRRVSAYVMARQEAFLRHGPRELRPLTRAEVAEALDVHESTVSRATSDKYVLLPNRQVVPFANFFKASLSVQDVLREIIENEDEPLSDSALSDALAERGFKVARRTVAKYRNEMGILPSSLR